MCRRHWKVEVPGRLPGLIAVFTTDLAGATESATATDRVHLIRGFDTDVPSAP